ncbi:MAG: hypothetical protein PHX34_03055 [Candidatus Shapirobacteria bacterium]|nr:hypothetical protein [Candidatus Shapirobacteria bacterium]
MAKKETENKFEIGARICLMALGATPITSESVAKSLTEIVFRKSRRKDSMQELSVDSKSEEKENEE